MELRIKLPNQYLELDQEDMMYLDGGGLVTVSCSKAFMIDLITAGSSFLLAAIGAAIGGFVGAAVAKAITPIAMGALGWILGGTIARSSVTRSSYTLFKADIPLIGRTSMYLS